MDEVSILELGSIHRTPFPTTRMILGYMLLRICNTAIQLPTNPCAGAKKAGVREELEFGWLATGPFLTEFLKDRK
ncbi:uncharacterized protein Dsimw501_GD29329 [Drosophila simulans]|uniref:Uncharacterized protein n=1 Tax=Drosophila simulans TaxID=7240 RepID=A0A0J9S0A5_DROSI|nr:uncharacterized protein Dsimw501_GD29329 [Drosophila simulans]